MTFRRDDMAKYDNKSKNQEVKNRDVNAATRASLAVTLRTSGMGYENIALQAGYASAGAAHNAIQRELKRTLVANVEELRREEQVILSKMHSEVWELAMNKDYKGRLFAFDRLISIRERFSKLMNLDIRPEEQLTQQNYTKRIILTTDGDIEVCQQQ